MLPSLTEQVTFRLQRPADLQSGMLYVTEFLQSADCRRGRSSASGSKNHRATLYCRRSTPPRQPSVFQHDWLWCFSVAIFMSRRDLQSAGTWVSNCAGLQIKCNLRFTGRLDMQTHHNQSFTQRFITWPFVVPWDGDSTRPGGREESPPRSSPQRAPEGAGAHPFRHRYR